MDSKTFQSILALNNFGVTLARKNCFDHAIHVFIKILNQFGEDETPVHTSRMLNTAYQSLELRHLLANASITSGFGSQPITLISADFLIRYVRNQFHDDFDGERVPRKSPNELHLIYFTESIDANERSAWETVVAIIFYNLGTAHFAISNTKEEKVNNAVLAAHYLWEYSAFLCERVIYDDMDATADWITMARCLLLLLYRCLQDTSITLSLEGEDEFFGSFVEESVCLWKNEIFRKIPLSQTSADAA